MVVIRTAAVIVTTEMILAGIRLPRNILLHVRYVVNGGVHAAG
jgi:hypothetical protein